MPGIQDVQHFIFDRFEELAQNLLVKLFDTKKLTWHHTTSVLCREVSWNDKKEKREKKTRRKEKMPNPLHHKYVYYI